MSNYGLHHRNQQINQLPYQQLYQSQNQYQDEQQMEPVIMFSTVEENLYNLRLIKIT